MSYLNEGASHVIVTSVSAHALNLCKLCYSFFLLHYVMHWEGRAAVEPTVCNWKVLVRAPASAYYAGKAWRLKIPFHRPRTVREAYDTGYSLHYVMYCVNVFWLVCTSI
jgi:hypothetical protein